MYFTPDPMELDMLQTRVGTYQRRDSEAGTYDRFYNPDPKEVQSLPGSSQESSINPKTYIISPIIVSHGLHGMCISKTGEY